MRQRWVSIFLLMCIAGIGAWAILSQRSQRPYRPFDLTAADFASFQPRLDRWVVRPVPLGADDPTAADVVALSLTDRSGAIFLVRLVHAYNMPMCMKIQQYAVDLVPPVIPSGGRPSSAIDMISNDVVQIWRLTSITGSRAIWITRMLEPGGWRPMDIDIRNMAFPRVGTPDDPSWAPQGLTWASLKHPWRNLATAVRSRWNASRCDLPTFLRLRQPAWVSGDLFVLVAASPVPHDPSRETETIRRTDEAARWFLDELQRWHGRVGYAQDAR